MYKRIKCYRCKWYSRGLGEFIPGYTVEMCIRPRGNNQKYILVPPRRKVDCNFYRVTEDIILYKIEEFSKELHNKRDPAHDFSHIKRIIMLCRRIAPPNTDIELVTYAAYFHDVLSEELNIRKFLKDLGLDDEYIERILNIVKIVVSNKPRTLEEKTLYDANILDALGAIGIARSFMKGGYEKQSLVETMEIIKKKMKRRIYTPVAKKLAKERRSFMKTYLRELEREMAY